MPTWLLVVTLVCTGLSLLLGTIQLLLLVRVRNARKHDQP